MAHGIHQEQSLLGLGVAGGEHQVGAVLAVDVRHVEAGVAIDRGPGIAGRIDRRGDAAGHLAERRVLVVAVDRGGGQGLGDRHHPGVQRVLGHERLGWIAGRLVRGQVGRVDGLALALGQDRVKRAEDGDAERRE